MKNFIETHGKLSKILMFSLGLLLCSCVARVENSGYIFDEDSLRSLKIGQSTKSEILQSFGSPSQKSLYGQETWFYTSQTKEQIAFLRPKVVNQQALVLKFDNQEKLVELKTYQLSDSKLESFSNESTEVGGDNNGVIRQFIGNIGKFKNDKKRPTQSNE